MNPSTPSPFSVRFWGVRGSYPTPGPTSLRYGGNTPCVQVSVNGLTIILDSGTGIIPLGRHLVQRARQSGRPVEALLLLSHLHHDHNQGFPFFIPAFLPTSRLHIYGPELLGINPRSALEQVMQPPFFPLRLNETAAELRFNTLREGDTLLIGSSLEDMCLRRAGEICPPFSPDVVQVSVLRSYAHPQGVMHYRITWREHALVYATDTEGYINGDQRLAAFARNADLLIHDAQYTDEHYLGLLPGIPVTQGFGHSTVGMACAVAQAAGVKRLALFHHAPEYDDQRLDQIAEQARRLFPETVVAAEGLELDLCCDELAIKKVRREM